MRMRKAQSLMRARVRTCEIRHCAAQPESAIFPINAHLAYAMKRVDCLALREFESRHEY